MFARFKYKVFPPHQCERYQDLQTSQRRWCTKKLRKVTSRTQAFPVQHKHGRTWKVAGGYPWRNGVKEYLSIIEIATVEIAMDSNPGVACRHKV